MNDNAFFDILPKYRLSKVSGLPIFGHFVPILSFIYLQILDFSEITLVNLMVIDLTFSIFKTPNRSHYLLEIMVIRQLTLLIYMQ